MIKKMMIRGMDAVMLTCEEATYLITKSEYVKLGCIKRMQLKMHLMGCVFCRRFKLQSELINENLEQLELLEAQQAKQEIPLEKKEKMQTLVEEALAK